jgi:hypothetical protein
MIVTEHYYTTRFFLSDVLFITNFIIFVKWINCLLIPWKIHKLCRS